MEQMMTSAFRAALAKCQSANKYTVDTSFEEFADELTRDVFAILFPRNVPESASVDVVRIPTVEDTAPKTKKKPGPKPKLDENGQPIAKKPRAKKNGGGGEESESESVASVAPKAEEKAEEKTETKEVVVEEAKAKKPRAKKAAAVPAVEGPLNFDKFTPTDTKKLKAIAAELSVEADKKALLAYMNGLSKEEFNAKKAEDHFRDFLTPKPAAKAEEDEGEEREMLEIEFKGKTYLVDAATKRVYEERNDVTVCVGHVGAGDFAKMVLPEEE